LCRSSRGQIAHEYQPWSHQLAMASCQSLANCPLQPNSLVSCSTWPPPAMLVWHQEGEPAIWCKIMNGPCNKRCLHIWTKEPLESLTPSIPKCRSFWLF
jgi:hypothetical protein